MALEVFFNCCAIWHFGAHMLSCCRASRHPISRVLLVSLILGSLGGISRAVSLNGRTRKEPYELRLGGRRLAFDPASQLELEQLHSVVVRQLKDLTDDQDSDDARVEKRYIRGLKEIRRLTEEGMADLKTGGTNHVFWPLLETVMAVNNSQRSPVPVKLDGAQAPLELARKFRTPVGHGESPATNLQQSNEADLSRMDPEPSSFWRKPVCIANQDLYHGFSRRHCVSLREQFTTYAGPKETFGMNPGFTVECEGRKVKLKLAEVSCEPFASRIFSALGYNAEATDFSPGVKVRYDRRLFLEFNSRKELTTRFTVLGLVPVYTLKLQRHYDPFDYIAAAVLRDGRRWSGHELKSRLLYHPSASRPETEPANFRPEVESLVDYLVTTAANVQVKEPGIKSIGPWDFGQLDHADRRELRGAGLLAAWLGWFDTRYDNTRLRTVKRHGQVELRHYFSDLGGVLGETSGFLFSKGERPNAFPWTFTRPPLRQGPHRLARPLRIEGYKPIAPTPAFAAMTLDDARWMARLIGQLTETQIVQALMASGYDSAEIRLYTEKLLSRRDRMLLDLGLTPEIPLCRPRGFDRQFSYAPATAGPVTTEVPDEGRVEAPAGHKRIVAGKLTK